MICTSDAAARRKCSVGHVSRKMIEHYSHIRMEAKRTALDAIAKPVSEVGVAQNWAQSSRGEKPTVRN